MAIEDLEYGRRKIGAVLLGVVGFIVLVLSIFFIIGGIAGGGAMGVMGIFMLIGGGLMIGYASYLWHKITHVVWTKQAIREMWDKQQKAESEYYQTSNKKCPSCGFPFEQDDVYCPNCGTELQTSGQSSGQKQFCPECGHPVSEGDKYCENCGTELNLCPKCGYIAGAAKYCPKCGTELRGSDNG